MVHNDGPMSLLNKAKESVNSKGKDPSGHEKIYESKKFMKGRTIKEKKNKRQPISRNGGSE